MGVGHPAGVHNGSRRAGGPTKKLGQLLDHLVRLGFAKPATTRNHHCRLVELGTLALLSVRGEHPGGALGAQLGDVPRVNGRRAAARGFRREGLGPDHVNPRRRASEAGVEDLGPTENGVLRDQRPITGLQSDDVGQYGSVDPHRQAGRRCPARRRSDPPKWHQGRFPPLSGRPAAAATAGPGRAPPRSPTVCSTDAPWAPTSPARRVGIAPGDAFHCPGQLAAPW